MPTIKADRKKVLQALRKTDWAAQDALTDRDIKQQVDSNPDAAPILTPADFARGKKVVPDDIDVHAVRARLGLTQTKFAAAFGVSVGTVRNWEQHRVRPAGAARVLLHVIERHPEAIRETLQNL